MIPWGPDDRDDLHVCDTTKVTTYANGDTLLSCRTCGRELAYLVSEGPTL